MKSARLPIEQPEQADLRDLVRTQLRGRGLVCCCYPKPCHGDTLARLANE